MRVRARSMTAPATGARLAAPVEHLGLTVWPDGAALRSALRGAAPGNGSLLGTPLCELRARLRRRLELSGPVIVTGHQAEFFHVGVFSKILAMDLLARRANGNALFLTVDSDLPKATHLTVPWAAPEGLVRERIPIPDCDPTRPMEFQPRAPLARWDSFFDRLTSVASAGLPELSLLERFVRAWIDSAVDPLDPVEGLVRGRQAVERALGLGSRDVRVSLLSETPEFRALIGHVLLHARRCAECYNAAQADFRRRHRIRGEQRPVPALHLSPEKIETPLWAVRDTGRFRLFVRPEGGELVLLADKQAFARLTPETIELSLTEEGTWPFAGDGWRVRPRALLVSGFARLCLADLFIHGLGGARYDEITDAFLGALLNTQPAPLICVSATAWLPLGEPVDAALAEPADGARLERDLRFNPERYVAAINAMQRKEKRALLQRSQWLAANEPHDHAARRAAFDAIRAWNDRVLEQFPSERQAVLARARDLARREREQAVSRDREYFFALHPRSTMVELAARIASRLPLP
jgi:hypothetical protein